MIPKSDFLLFFFLPDSQTRRQEAVLRRRRWHGLRPPGHSPEESQEMTAVVGPRPPDPNPTPPRNPLFALSTSLLLSFTKQPEIKPIPRAFFFLFYLYFLKTFNVMNCPSECVRAQAAGKRAAAAGEH